MLTSARRALARSVRLAARRRASLRGLLADVSPLRESPAFRRLWIGSALSGAGTSMTTFALILEVYDLTRSSLAVGIISLVQLVPTICTGLLGGLLIDKLDRRIVTLFTSSGLTFVSALLAVQAFLDLRQLWVLYVLAALRATLWTIDGPARMAILPKLVGADRIAPAMALNQLSGFTVSLIGPLLAGVIAAAAGLKTCFAVDVASYSAAIYSLVRMPAMPLGSASGRRGLRSALDGITFVRRSPVLLAVFLTDLNATVLGSPTALFPAINAERFGGHPQTLGVLNAGIAVGGILGSVFSGPLRHVRYPGRAMLVTVMLWGLAIAGFGLSYYLWLAFAMLAIASAADTTTIVFRTTVVQQAIPEHLRGRVSTLDYLIGVGGVPLGNVEAGVVASLSSPTASVLSGGLGATIGATLIRLCLPAIAAHDMRPGSSQDHTPQSQDYAPQSGGHAPQDPRPEPAEQTAVQPGPAA